MTIKLLAWSKNDRLKTVNRNYDIFMQLIRTTLLLKYDIYSSESPRNIVHPSQFRCIFSLLTGKVFRTGIYFLKTDTDFTQTNENKNRKIHSKKHVNFKRYFLHF